ncbi:C40 family peptidase [Streptomyces sp. SID5910]|uniref:C40 family peptidase n=1 Tax=Streptomyces sp. SID5910 TaxID=2690312 RepID=UPI0013721DE7|nr:C40 family peptidase [Streptomyces sp. SID5910]MYR42399.1 hypothetical protein [Streptomyces sp. SID5910]
MSGRLLRLVCTAAATAGIALAPAPATARPAPEPTPVPAPPVPTAEQPAPAPAQGEKSVAELLTELQGLYREAEKATETYNGTEDKLTRQRAKVQRLETELARARLSLRDGRGAVGRLARQQYRNSSDLSPYLRLLLARDPQHALDQGHVMGQLARARVETVGRLADREKKAGDLARRARKALDEQTALAERQKKDRDGVRDRLRAVEDLLASLSTEQLAQLTALEDNGIAEAQERLMASGAVGDDKPSAEGDRAVRFAVEQLGKPYQWGAEGPAAYDCSGLTSVAWQRAGTPIPRTSQEQWARLERVPLEELRPGDLVVYFPEATHVALYLGDGMVVQAPRPGAEVKVSPIAANPVLGAVRPDPGEEPLRRYTPPSLPTGASDGSDAGYGATYAPAAPETSIR